MFAKKHYQILRITLVFFKYNYSNLNHGKVTY